MVKQGIYEILSSDLYAEIIGTERDTPDQLYVEIIEDDDISVEESWLGNRESRSITCTEEDIEKLIEEEAIKKF